MAAVLAADTAAVVATRAVAVAVTVVAWAEALAWAVVHARSSCPTFVPSSLDFDSLTDPLQLPFQVGWQDLKDLFRQAGRSRTHLVQLLRCDTDHLSR